MAPIDYDAYEDDWTDDPMHRPRSGPSDEALAARAELPVGVVIAMLRYRPQVLFEGEIIDCVYAGSMRGEKVTVADRVRVDPPADDNSPGRIVGLLPRDTVLFRSGDDEQDAEEARAVVANVDRVIVVLTTDRLTQGVGLLRRVVAAADDSDAAPDILWCMNKIDLHTDETQAEFDAVLDELGNIEGVAISAKHGTGVETVVDMVTSGWSAFIGHSGVGKSTLFNRLLGGDVQSTAATGRFGGRHTTVGSLAIPYRHEGTDPDGGPWLVDTPGFRSFGLAHLDDA